MKEKVRMLVDRITSRRMQHCSDKEQMLQSTEAESLTGTSILKKYTWVSQHVNPLSKRINKLFHCKLCPKKSLKHHTMTCHLKWHLDIKDYRCNNCNVDFVQKSNLSKHLKTKSCLAKHNRWEHLRNFDLKNISLSHRHYRYTMLQIRLIKNRQFISKIQDQSELRLTNLDY